MPKTQEIIDMLNDKLDEACDFLNEMEATKSDERLFRHRLSAFLSAAESVITFINYYGGISARGKGKEDLFNNWIENKFDQFRVPGKETKKGKAEGKDKAWVYLRVARNQNIHIQMIETNIREVAIFSTRLAHVDESGGYGGAQTPKLETQNAPKDLWGFKDLTIKFYEKGKEIKKPEIVHAPPQNVVTACEEHMKKMIDFIEEFRGKLESY